MSKKDFYDEQQYISLKRIIPKYLILIVVGYITAFFLTSQLLYENGYIVHIIIDLFYTFIALSTFLLVWNSYKDTTVVFRQLGFGMLMVAIFNSINVYLHLNPVVPVYMHTDLSVKFCLVGRLVESLIILSLSLNWKEMTTNKWKKLFQVLFFTFGISYAIVLYPDILPTMLGEQGLTAEKVVFEYIIIGISILNLYNLSYRIRDKNENTCKYIFMSLLFVITSELIFIIDNTINGFSMVYGHLIRVVYYYYLYKAVYVCSIEHPYRKLEEAYSEQEKANARIKEMSDTLNNTLDDLPIGILKYEHDNRVKYMNKQLEEILACDKNDFYELKMDELFKAIPIVEGDVNIYQLIEESDNNSVNTIIGIKNLKNEYVKLSITSQKIRSGVIMYINEVKRQQEIKYFHLQTQTILNALSNAILIIDKNKKIILHNETFQKIFEIEKLEIIGMDLKEFHDIIGFKGHSLAELLTVREGHIQPQGLSITTLKGNKLELLNYRAPIINVEDEIIGAISIFTDITEIRKYQHIIQQQEKLALIGQMAAGIVHEIKNPMATIKGLSQLISVRTKLDKVKEYSDVIDSTIDDVTNVVNEFLSFARPKPAVIARTSINKIVESMQLITETQCYTKNIRSQFHYSSLPMEISADEMKIKQVMLNITENAIFALEMVELPELIVSTYYDVDLKEGVIKIADNGIGMSPEVVGKIGTPFFTTKEKGTGLGLGICYEIMREHKGRIDVESEEGKGTVFKIIFTQIEDLL